MCDCIIISKDIKIIDNCVFIGEKEICGMKIKCIEGGFGIG